MCLTASVAHIGPQVVSEYVYANMLQSENRFACCMFARPLDPSSSGQLLMERESMLLTRAFVPENDCRGAPTNYLSEVFVLLLFPQPSCA